jgi:uridine phosphorylase
MSRDLINPDFPVSQDGKTMHLNVGPGDVNPRILSVGDHGRGERVSKLLENVIEHNSTRGFVTYSGNYKGVPVSVIVTGMGIAMMDFVVRESTFHISSKVSFIRLGTCGILKASTKPGSLIVASHARYLSQNYDFPNGEPYLLSEKIQSSVELTESLKGYLKKELGEENVDWGVDITCETFYSAQGRLGSQFDDFNEGVVEGVVEKEPEVAAMEMETFKLLQLAKASKGKIAATACMIGLINRQTKEMIDFSTVPQLEIQAARAAFETLISYSLDN